MPPEPTWICVTCGMANSFDDHTCMVCHNPMTAVQRVSDCPNFDEYQKVASQTRASYPDDYRLIVAALGLAGEAGEYCETVVNLVRSSMQLSVKTGEFCDLVKKIYGQGHELDKNKLQNELGDILWYLADACSALSIQLSDTAIKNIEKLRKRYPNGFDEKISRGRYE